MPKPFTLTPLCCNFRSEQEDCNLRGRDDVYGLLLIKDRTDECGGLRVTGRKQQQKLKVGRRLKPSQYVRQARASDVHVGLSMPNVRAKRATTAGRQARAGENVRSTTGPGLVA